jgi:hypothetical protein
MQALGVCDYLLARFVPIRVWSRVNFHALIIRFYSSGLILRPSFLSTNLSRAALYLRQIVSLTPATRDMPVTSAFAGLSLHNRSPLQRVPLGTTTDMALATPVFQLRAHLYISVNTLWLYFSNRLQTSPSCANQIKSSDNSSAVPSSVIRIKHCHRHAPIEQEHCS